MSVKNGISFSQCGALINVCLSFPDLFHQAWYPLGLSVQLELAEFNFSYSEKYSIGVSNIFFSHLSANWQVVVNNQHLVVVNNVALNTGSTYIFSNGWFHGLWVGMESLNHTEFTFQTSILSLSWGGNSYRTKAYIAVYIH